MPLDDHPLRYVTANELHARPFPVARAPGWAAFLAIKQAEEAAARDRALERAHLLELLDRFGAPHPQPDATHWYGRLGRHWLKWESHTEFVTYTLIGEGEPGPPFDPALFAQFPPDWLARAPGLRLTSALFRIELAEGDERIAPEADAWFVPESLAVSRVLDNELVIASDFRIDPAGHLRFAIWVRPGVGERRIGRVVQRLCEIETYKAMAMLGFARARALSPEMGRIEARLSALVAGMAAADRPEEALDSLLAISAAIEGMAATASYRFGATSAYEAIVAQRIEALREERFEGRQTLAEFMARRFDPAMRTVASSRARLEAMAARAIRAGDLLRTRVDVDRSAQSQKLLASMDRRADMALRLQHTVEGLSVVAVSYYGVGLLLYLLAPLTHSIDKAWLGAAVTPLVVLVTWIGLRRIRRRLHG
ncbi:putative membrane-anchored protein putative in bacteria [Rubellimicrobium thermophilum DSM 16684]|uniref:Putative membrane-anchored protein putative in bacteria n=1 Tax=Rubellimicrobium thermophilum DSM 16684 TaxID=1123069 RepID=S9QY96_9RHOB|nr:DUF3422 domain-containing protein [Rubellimicrobium thermophilum]EPX86371.1 putative membrane-anchored protein putative in bacteria [Rubellimicrobium thermophilum DSM 16684]